MVCCTFHEWQYPRYELKENAKFYDNWPDTELSKNAAISDVTRIFTNKDISLNVEERANMKEGESSEL